MNETLDYSPSGPAPRMGFVTIAIAGGVAGAATFYSAFLVGPLLYLGVGMAMGVALSAAAARASVGREFRAGFLASAVAATTMVGMVAFRTTVLSEGVGRFRVGVGLVTVALCWALFALPGLLGSAYYWEGRRSMSASADRGKGGA